MSLSNEEEDRIKKGVVVGVRNWIIKLRCLKNPGGL